MTSPNSIAVVQYGVAQVQLHGQSSVATPLQSQDAHLARPCVAISTSLIQTRTTCSGGLHFDDSGAFDRCCTSLVHPKMGNSMDNAPLAGASTIIYQVLWRPREDSNVRHTISETDAQDVCSTSSEAVTPVGPKAYPQMRVTPGYERHDQPIRQ